MAKSADGFDGGGTRGIILKDKEGKDIDCQLLVLAHLNFPNSLMSDTLP